MIDVVVTGMGVVSPIGIGLEAFWQNLMAGQSGIQSRPLLERANSPLQIGGEVRDFEGKEYVKPRKALKVMCRPIQFGFAAAEMALQQANVQGQVEPPRFSTVFGTETFYADPQEVASVFRKCIVNRVYDHDQWGKYSMKEIEPLWMLKYLPNMVASHIAIAHGAEGPSNTICQSEASASLAIAEAADLISRGSADVVLAGATGSPLSITGAIYRGDQLLSRRLADPETACRPFDRDRDGMVLGEGAGCLVLENRKFAEARGARPIASIAGIGRSFSPPIADSFADGLAYTIQQSITSAGAHQNDIHHVNASGFSTERDDRWEAAAIRQVLGNTPVIAPKSNFGNLGPGTGAVELIASICALQNNFLPPVLNYQQPDPRCPINVVSVGNGQASSATASAAVSINHSTTGQITSLLVRLPQ